MLLPLLSFLLLIPLSLSTFFSHAPCGACNCGGGSAGGVSCPDPAPCPVSPSCPSYPPCPPVSLPQPVSPTLYSVPPVQHVQFARDVTDVDPNQQPTIVYLDQILNDPQTAEVDATASRQQVVYQQLPQGGSNLVVPQGSEVYALQAPQGSGQQFQAPNVLYQQQQSDEPAVDEIDMKAVDWGLPVGNGEQGDTINIDELMKSKMKNIRRSPIATAHIRKVALDDVMSDEDEYEDAANLATSAEDWRAIRSHEVRVPTIRVRDAELIGGKREKKHRTVSSEEPTEEVDETTEASRRGSSEEEESEEREEKRHAEKQRKERKSATTSPRRHPFRLEVLDSDPDDELERRRQSHRNHNDKHSKSKKAKRQETKHKAENDNELERKKCNSRRLYEIMLEHISESSAASKRLINKAAEDEFGGSVDVICSRGHFSYVFSSNLYCEASKGHVTCIAFRQAVPAAE